MDYIILVGVVMTVVSLGLLVYFRISEKKDHHHTKHA